MNYVWTYVATGLLLAAAASIVVSGEVANAELRLVDEAMRTINAGSAASPSAGPALSTTAGTAVATSN